MRPTARTGNGCFERAEGNYRVGYACHFRFPLADRGLIDSLEHLRQRCAATSVPLQNAELLSYEGNGLTFLNGELYVNTVWAGNLYRIPMDATGKAAAPVAVQVPRVLRSPDGMRAMNGKIYLAESGNGTVSAITIANDVATITTVKSGLNGPCAVEPHGNVVWAVERPSSRVTSWPIQ